LSAIIRRTFIRIHKTKKSRDGKQVPGFYPGIYFEDFIVSPSYHLFHKLFLSIGSFLKIHFYQ